ncbi:MAG: transcription antitermination factor NusB [Rhodospirillaceae bacterium]|jgi:N utilization substance protein B|nr:transcription antitermination factor NusB [Rhodospirillaceae bacterium]MBT5357190.1 transcription antitermination factor NusB [Rhodospirillaceae bacterium]MBT5770354.1 transcription antitermination factor NusB [Rhodospirillaceae bacterium]MBT6311013.1 transcription antitermination factor NusB [Rhodospirillaceae bacterium]MBT7366185.1 transcription antitermination factor NusB [Rhodospirillaceae bacterium]
MAGDSEATASAGRKSGASARGAARLLAVQALYQMDIRGGTAESTVMEFIEHRTDAPTSADSDEGLADPRDADKALFADLVNGVARDRTDLNAALDGCLDGANTMERLEPLLRAILGAGAYELRSRDDIPARVAISEYVRLTDAFFEGKEPGLVNAVLDRLARVVRNAETTKRKPAAVADESDDEAPAEDVVEAAAEEDTAGDDAVKDGTDHGARD